MALNKVMVASNVGGHRELIRDGETGNLFVAGDVNDLAKTVLRVLENRAAWPSQIAGRAQVRGTGAFVEKQCGTLRAGL